MSDEIVLTADESRALIHAMTHPDEDALRKRDAFIRDVRGLKIDYGAGEITAEVENSSLTFASGRGILCHVNGLAPVVD